jgi:hypothetical protein
MTPFFWTCIGLYCLVVVVVLWCVYRGAKYEEENELVAGVRRLNRWWAFGTHSCLTPEHLEDFRYLDRKVQLEEPLELWERSYHAMLDLKVSLVQRNDYGYPADAEHLLSLLGEMEAHVVQGYWEGLEGER